MRWLVGLPPAGTTDPLTRAIAAQLSDRLGQRVYVENKAGANQTIAAREAAGAPADGYTLLSIGGPQVYTDATVPTIGRGLDPVIRMATQPMVIAGTAERPTPDLRSVLDAARAAPDAWSFASAGIGSSHHVVGAYLNLLAGTRITHVPYRGGGAAIQDAAAGHIPLIVIGVGPVVPHVAAGRMRAYAVTTARRVPALPDVPTMQELGFAGFDLAQWHGVAIRSGTPAPIIERLNSEMRAILDTPDLKRILEATASENGAGSSAEWGRFYTEDIARWTELMQRLDIAAQ
jgi:tripartite-type tricarboxylate transporter receptor subunit TctC